MPNKRFNYKCPAPLAHVYVAERFGIWPGWIKKEPLHDVLYYFNILSIESDVSSQLEGVEAGEEVFLEDDDEDGDEGD